MNKKNEISFSTHITAENTELSDLRPSWSTAEFTPVDGLGTMNSLHEAGDSLVAVVSYETETPIIIGSGVMIAPGLLLTATHVLETFPKDGKGPVFMTFLPNGSRLWLPSEATSVIGKSDYNEENKISSDLSLVSCTLNSEAYIPRPLMLAPMKVTLPLIGQRLWAFGFRHQGHENGITSISPMVSSGLVTAAFPHGRGNRMPSACFEVNMDTLGGMSGGPVVNSEGYVVGIVSSSFDGGPSYITLIWEALRLNFKGTTLALKKHENMNLIKARSLGFIKLEGNVRRRPWGDVMFIMTDDEINLLQDSTAQSLKIKNENTLHGECLDKFTERWLESIEDACEQAAIELLENDSDQGVKNYLLLSFPEIPSIRTIYNFTVEILEGLEDLEILSIEKKSEDLYYISVYFDFRIVTWEIDTEYENCIEKNNTTSDVASSFYRREKINIMHRCYFKADVFFNTKSEDFAEISFNWRGIRSKGNI